MGIIVPIIKLRVRYFYNAMSQSLNLAIGISITNDKCVCGKDLCICLFSIYRYNATVRHRFSITNYRYSRG